MPSDVRGRPNSVIGPSGEPLTIADLPPPQTKRWVIRRKAEVVAAVRGGLLTLEEACERYSLSSEEIHLLAEAGSTAMVCGAFARPGCKSTAAVHPATAQAAARGAAASCPFR